VELVWVRVARGWARRLKLSDQLRTLNELQFIGTRMLRLMLSYVDKFKFNVPLELLQVGEKTMKIELELERERLTRGFWEKNPVTFIQG
jgi:hypothetical protein